MKFYIKRDAFLHELNHVIRAIPSQSPIPILTGLKITVSPTGLTLSGSDSNISIISEIKKDNEDFQLEIDSPGSVVIDGRKFADIIRKLPLNEVTIELDENNIAHINSGEANFDLVGYSGDNYPQLPDYETDNTTKLPTVEFKTMIDQTLFSTSNQETRPILTGINFTVTDYGSLVAIATDSHRLSRREMGLNDLNLDFTEITLPKKTAQELNRIVEDDDDLYMQIIDNQAVFIVNNLTIISRLLEGNYPPTDRLIPESYSTELIVNSHLFNQSVDRVAIMSNNKMNNAVQLTIDSDSVELYALGGERGQATENVAYIEANGEPLQISFNFTYMKDALNAFDGKDVKIQFQGPDFPFIIAPVEKSEKEHDELLQLMTPIRTHNTY